MSSPATRAAGEAGGARVAVIERRGKFLVAEPFFGPGPRLAISRDKRANVGDLVVVRQAAGRNGRARGRAVISRRLGRPDVARDVIEAFMLERGLRRSFDPAVEHEARDLVSGSGDAASGFADAGRRDLRSLATFTIDPATARDYDDAISAAVEGDGWRVWVHIADVSAYVAPRSLIDREAYRRGTSVYVPGAVEPMLPGALSNDACSLVPGQDRLTVTVEMTIVGEQVKQASFYPSVIRSDERLDYAQVDRVFAGSARAAEPWGEPLAAARAAAAALEARRARRAALVLDSSEPEFEFDDAGHVVAIDSVQQTESHRLIEHLMIAANEQVAGLLESRRVPTLYRVHERPESTAVQRLIEQLASLGVPTPPVPRGATDTPGGGGPRRRGFAAGQRLGGAERTRSARADKPRVADFEAGLLRPSQPRSRRAPVAALLPLHLADPPIPRPDLSPGAAVRGRRRWGRARCLVGPDGGPVVLGAGAGRDVR